MKIALSPKELAEAIGVSESSMKRWADDGRLHVSRTAGGHRRIPIAEAIRFVRDLGATVVRPDLLGLPDLAQESSEEAPSGDAASQLHDALARGDARAVRALVVSRYLSGERVATICDGPLRTALARIGDLWQHSDEGIFIEHRATDICIQALNQLRALLDQDDNRPVALGGSLARDPYLIPSLSVSVVLSSIGFHTINLGADTPSNVLLRAARQYRPRIVWLSISNVQEPSATAQELALLAESLGETDARLVIGGRQSTEVTLPRKPHVLHFGSMSELEGEASKILAQPAA
jgi:excisionase family DNA binding protein